MSIDFEALQTGEIFIWQSVWLKKFSDDPVSGTNPVLFFL